MNGFRAVWIDLKYAPVFKFNFVILNEILYFYNFIEFHVLLFIIFYISLIFRNIEFSENIMHWTGWNGQSAQEQHSRIRFHWCLRCQEQPFYQDCFKCHTSQIVSQSRWYYRAFSTTWSCPQLKLKICIIMHQWKRNGEKF